MLSINDCSHLKLLYEQFLKQNTYIRDLILKDDWESVDIAVQEKEKLIRQIVRFEKPRLKDIKENQELNDMRLNLIKLEEDNIDLVKSLKDKALSEISNVKKAKKIMNAYEPLTNNVISTLDILDEE